MNEDAAAVLLTLIFALTAKNPQKAEPPAESAVEISEPLPEDWQTYAQWHNLANGGTGHIRIMVPSEPALDQ